MSASRCSVKSGGRNDVSAVADKVLRVGEQEGGVRQRIDRALDVRNDQQVALAADQRTSPAVSHIRPLINSKVASPRFACSASWAPSFKAITV